MSENNFASANLTAGQLNAIVKKLGGEEGALRFLRGELCVVAKEAATPLPNAAPSLNWRDVYEKLGMVAQYDAQIASLAIVEREGLWTIPVIQGVTCNKVVAGLKSAGCKVYLYTEDLDKAVTQNDRDPVRDGSYQVSFRALVEADPETKNQSANQRQKQGCKDATLLERLLLEAGYFLATGKNLDQESVTLCAGSRDSDGNVPDVLWSPDNHKVYVRWYYPDLRSDYWRFRPAVPQANS